MIILKQFGAALLLAAMSFPLWATAPNFDGVPGEVAFKTKVVEQKSVAVQLYNLGQERTTIEVQDREGKVYYQKSIKGHNGYSIVLHLDELPQSSYIISVSHKDGVSTQVVRIEEDGLMLSQIVEEE
ncbi:MAG: hypothetical protein J5I98_07825 [Phaeodactylibacter sp.]|nr:hypothetical protein [Phaeodactylibacter sp.]